VGIKTKKKKKFRKWQKNSGAIFEKGGVNMGWEELLKRGLGISVWDKRLLKYILRDGEFKTFERIMDEIYDFIEENKKMTRAEITAIEGRPTKIKFGAGKTEIKTHMATSPDYEVRNTGNRTNTNSPILEYRYIGE